MGTLREAGSQHVACGHQQLYYGNARPTYRYAQGGYGNPYSGAYQPFYGGGNTYNNPFADLPPLPGVGPYMPNGYNNYGQSQQQQPPSVEELGCRIIESLYNNFDAYDLNHDGILQDEEIDYQCKDDYTRNTFKLLNTTLKFASLKSQDQTSEGMIKEDVSIAYEALRQGKSLKEVMNYCTAMSEEYVSDNGYNNSNSNPSSAQNGTEKTSFLGKVKKFFGF